MIALLAVAALAQQSVSPPEAASLRPVELAELVTDLLPADGSAQRGWTPRPRPSRAVNWPGRWSFGQT